MQITQLQRQQAEEQANEIQLRLYGEPEAGEQLWNIATLFGLTERSTYYTFSQMVGDIVLGFYGISDVLRLVQYNFPNLEPIKQLELEMEVKKFLLPLNTISPSLQSEIAEIESVTKSLETVHTMQQDVERVQQETPIHQSSQDALLQRSETPAPHNPPTPRWETE